MIQIKMIKKKILEISLTIVISFGILLFFFPHFFGAGVSYVKGQQMVEYENIVSPVVLPPLDKVAYDKKLIEIANNPPPPQPTTKVVTDPKTKEKTTVVVPAKPAPVYAWPVKTDYPNAGAILPFKRVIAYYGNLYSRKMGVLGEYDEPLMLSKLDAEVKKWEAADPATPVQPALHYIAVVAQGSAGKDGKYRARMPDTEIDKVLAMAAKINAIVFLDLQVGFSTLQKPSPRIPLKEHWPA